MPIISAKDIENSRWKKNKKKATRTKETNKQTKTKKSKGREGETIGKGQS